MKKYTSHHGIVRHAAFTALALAAGVAATSAALGAEAKNLGNFNYWSAWQSTDANGVICYVSSTPQKMLPTSVDHGQVNFLVINRKGLGTRNEVQSLMGYELRGDPAPVATVDGKSYKMVIEGKAAWLASAADEPTFVASMKSGKELSVTATSKRGTNTSYSYSLSGVTAALKALDDKCK